MEDFDESLYHVWQANLNVLTGSPGGASRLARMMTLFAVVHEADRGGAARFQRGVRARRRNGDGPAAALDGRAPQRRPTFPPTPSAQWTRKRPSRCFAARRIPAPKRAGAARPGAAAFTDRSDAPRRRSGPSAGRDEPTRSAFQAESRTAGAGFAAPGAATGAAAARRHEPKAEELIASDKLSDAVEGRLVRASRTDRQAREAVAAACGEARGAAFEPGRARGGRIDDVLFARSRFGVVLRSVRLGVHGDRIAGGEGFFQRFVEQILFVLRCSGAAACFVRSSRLAFFMARSVMRGHRRFNIAAASQLCRAASALIPGGNPRGARPSTF